MSPITTHVLNTAEGRPAAGVAVTLEFSGEIIAQGTTDQDGRIRDLLADGHQLRPGAYRITFDTAKHSPFYPRIDVTFIIEDTSEHYHIPLLLSPFGYSTYRGS